VTPLTWGPNTYEDSLRWWGQALEEAFAACDRAPAGFVHTVRMESLLGTDRDPELARLLASMGLEETPEVRAFFDEKATTKRANIARWRTDVPKAELPSFLALHAYLVEKLAAKGRPYVPYDPPAGLPDDGADAADAADAGDAGAGDPAVTEGAAEQPVAAEG